MANRVIAGNHFNFGYGLFVSRPGKNVSSNLNASELIFSSKNTQFSAGIIEVVSGTAAGSANLPLTINFSTTYTNKPYILAVEDTSGTTAGVGVHALRFELAAPFVSLARTAFLYKVYTNKVIVEGITPSVVTFPVTFSIAVFQGST